MEDLLEEIGKELAPAEARETYVTLAKILGNIVKNPSEAKFRGLKKDNKVIAEKVLRSNAAISLLLAIGFDDVGSTYTCPPDSDLEPMRTAVDLLECIIVSTEEPAAAPAAPTAAAATAETPGPATTLLPPPAKPAAVPENPQGFKRRDDTETKRQEQMQQLQAARAAKNAQFQENPQGPAYVAPVTQAAGYPENTTAEETTAKKKAPTAFDFQDRGKKEQEKNQAALSLEEIRKQQKDKFKDFQNDPNAKKQEAYQQPPSVAPGTKADDGWGGWFGGLFGGGSSSNGKPSKPQQQERRGPNIKGVGDLPKPPRGGG